MEQGLQVETCFLIASLGMNVGSSAGLAQKLGFTMEPLGIGQHELIQVFQILFY